MNARLTALSSVTVAAAAIFIASCSSGLGNNLPPDPTPQDAPQASTNLPVGLDIGVELTDPAADAVVAGAVIPAIGTFDQRDVVLTVFTTADSGAAVSRDAVTDANGAADVFVAALCAQDVNPNAFSQSLAGKFRHPRCVTCHSMQSATTTAFVSAAAAQGQPHAGPLPGPGFPSNDPSTCLPCHLNSTADPVEDWQSPPDTFDLRTESVAALAARAQIPPTGDLEHFKNDPRVLWALDSGILPLVGGRNGVADDDHDGIDEPSDIDGVPRTVPGGSATFIAQIDAWEEDGFPVTAADAVCDVTLVSRAAGSAGAGNGASTKPQVVYVPNGAYVAGTAGTAGTLYVVYQSEASDIVAGDTNGASDVFRVAVDLLVDPDGEIVLLVNGDATLVSATDGTSNEGNGNSVHPVIGGSNGEIVAFQSQATDLVAGFTDGNGADGYDVYVRDLGTSATALVSHQVSNQATGGDGSSEAPAIASNGAGVAFESDASDLIASDTNGRRDVYYSDVSGSAPFLKTRASVSDDGSEGTGGDSGDASVYVSGGGRALVAFESNATGLAPALTAASNVYLFDSDSGTTTLLNHLLTSSLDEIGDGDAFNPVIGPDGANVAFESAATNIDVLREDGNGHTDVFLVDAAQALAGNVLPYRYSLTTVEASDANGDSTEPQFATFASSSGSYGVGFSVFRTAATNLANSDSTDLIVTFLAETSGVVADFSADTTSGAAPLTVRFTDESTGVPTSWAWDFDGDSVVDSTEQNPAFTFTTPGVYTVRLTATNAVSENTVTKTDLVTAIGAPVVDFTATPTSGPSALTVDFTDASSTAAEVAPDSWAWDFDNDGNVDSVLQNPQFTYGAPGTYAVTLTATNAAGSTSETKSDFVQVFAPVIAGFTSSPTSGAAPLSVTFTNTSTGANSYSWDFGDGSPVVTTQDPTHVFSAGGTFTVTLTATGPGGVSTDTDTINVGGSVNATFSLTPSSGSASSGYAGETVDLDASASTTTGTTPLTYEWDLDDDGSFDDATGASLTLTIGTAGGTWFPPPSAPTPSNFTEAHVIRLRVTDSGGGSGVTSQTFTTYASSVSANPLTPSKDTTIYQQWPDQCNPTSAGILSGHAYNGTSYGYRRSLMEFDVAGNLPAGSTILTSSLQLTCNLVPALGATGRTFSLHRVTTEWGATVNPGTSLGGGTTGAGVPTANPGDATWNSSMHPTAWTNAGGDYNGAASQQQIVSTTGAYTWASNASMVGDVQAWMTPANNHGWILIGVENPTLTTARGFGASENSTATSRPTLQVTFRPPLP